MRRGRTIRLNEDLYDIIKDIAALYKSFYIDSVNPTNIFEKMVVKGIIFYINDIKNREEREPNKEVSAKISYIEKNFNNYIENDGLKEKVVTFVTDEKLHLCIDSIAKYQQKAYGSKMSYNALVSSFLVRGILYYVNLLEQMLPYNKAKELNEIKIYITGLTDKLGKKYNYNEIEANEARDFIIIEKENEKKTIDSVRSKPDKGKNEEHKPMTH